MKQHATPARLALAAAVFLALAAAGFIWQASPGPAPTIAADAPQYADAAPPAPRQPDAPAAPIDRAALKAALHVSIREHRVFSYRQLWEALAYTDEDPDRPGYVVLLYTGWSRHADDHGNGQSQWNREHVWAKSRGDFGTRPGPGTDLHLVRPTDVSMNGARSNLAFDDGGELFVDGDGPTLCRRDRDSWEPRDEVKGDVARMLFYTAVRYETDPDLELTESVFGRNDKQPVHGVRSTLLRWHRLDPPDDAERRRNDRIEELQGNRNPFIDRPELVELLWGE